MAKKKQKVEEMKDADEMRQAPPETRPIEYDGAPVGFAFGSGAEICPHWWDGDRLISRLLHGWWCRRCRRNNREKREHTKWLQEAAFAERRHRTAEGGVDGKDETEGRGDEAAAGAEPDQ